MKSNNNSQKQQLPRVHRNVREMKARNQEMKRKLDLLRRGQQGQQTQLSSAEDEDSCNTRRRKMQQLRFVDETTNSDEEGEEEEEEEESVDEDDVEDDDDEWNTPEYIGDRLRRRVGNNRQQLRQLRMRRGLSESFIMDIGLEEEGEGEDADEFGR